jgi:hypothetical protein
VKGHDELYYYYSRGTRLLAAAAAAAATEVLSLARKMDQMYSSSDDVNQLLIQTQSLADSCSCFCCC